MHKPHRLYTTNDVAQLLGVRRSCWWWRLCTLGIAMTQSWTFPPMIGSLVGMKQLWRTVVAWLIADDPNPELSRLDRMDGLR